MALAAALASSTDASVLNDFDSDAEYQAVEIGSADDVQAWYELAVRARVAGDTDTALQAHERAAEHRMSPVRICLERARVRVLNRDNGIAVNELKKDLELGFTAVSVITSDPVLNQLSGQSQYDELVEKMSEQAYPCEHHEQFHEFDF